MKTNINAAQGILGDAAKTVDHNLAVHGDTERSFTMIAQMWSVHINHSMTIRKSNQLTAWDVSMMMDMVKHARATYGSSRDNYVDKAGYSALAAMLDTSMAEPVNRYNDKEHTDDEAAVQ